jgi:hypothetical protein
MRWSTKSLLCRAWRAPTAIERAVVGVAVCCLASIPLAIGYSLYGFSTSGEFTVITFMGGTAAFVIVACVITGLCSIFFGVPIYLLSARLKVLRPAVLLVAAAITGVVVHEVWDGGLFEDPEGALLFAFFGLYSGMAFWIGADVLLRSKPLSAGTLARQPGQGSGC